MKDIIRLILLCHFALCINLLYSEEKLWLQDISVKPGDSIYKIASEYLKDFKKWPEMLKYNSTLSSLTGGDMNKILPGMIIKVPIELIKKEKQEAIITKVINDVQLRKRDSIEWKKAEEAAKARYEDEVKTFENSYTEIKFAKGKPLKLGAHSYARVKPKEIVDEIELLLGELESERQKVITPGGGEMMPVITEKGESEIKTRVKADKTMQIMVKKGQAEVTGAGSTILVDEGFRTQVKLGKVPDKPLPLPKAVNVTTKLKEIGLSSSMLGESTSPVKNTEIFWESDTDIVQIHLQLSKDTAFKDIVYDKILEEKNFKMPALPDGKYYFRTSSLDKEEFESQYSEPKEYISDRTPPSFEIIYPTADVKVQGVIKLRGRSEINSTIGAVAKMSDKNKGLISENVISEKIGPLATSDFELSIKLFPGLNQITIWAQDEYGNIVNKKINVENIIKGKSISEQNIFINLPLDIEWDKWTNIRQVEIQIAPDPEFKNIVFSRKFGGPQDDYTSKLGDGRYFKRAKKTYSNGKESDWEDILIFVIDATPPKLVIKNPKPDSIVPNTFEIEGISEPRVSVGMTTTKINTSETITQQAEVSADGKFSFPVTLSEGKYNLSIWAIDLAGNIETKKVEVLVSHKSGNIWLKILFFTVLLGGGIILIPSFK